MSFSLACDPEGASRRACASASDHVFFGIVHALEMHQVVPGQRLVEMELASHYGVGRNAVREALQRLDAEGIVTLSRNRGAAIRLLSLKETLDVLEVAERMTGLLACTAARTAGASEHRQRLLDALEELAHADGAQDADAFARGRRHFYRALLALADSAELKRLFPAIQMPIVYAQHRLPGLQKLRLRDYPRIAQAVLKGAPSEADQAGMAHVHHVRELVLRKAAAQDF